MTRVFGRAMADIIGAFFLLLDAAGTLAPALVIFIWIALFLGAVGIFIWALLTT